MKKILYFLILIGISFIPSFVYASDTSTFQLNFNPLGGDSYTTLFSWLNDTSNTYIDTTLNDFEYYSIYTTYTNYTNYRQYDIYLYASHNLYYIDNTRQRGSSYGRFGIQPNTSINLSDHYIVYKENNTNNWYNSTSFNNNTLITSLGLSSLVSTSNNIVLANNYFWQLDSNTSNRINNIYMNNAPLSNNEYNRDLLLYNNDTLENIELLSNGDTFTGYRGIFYDKPSYLNGYVKLSLVENTQYYAISGIKKGIVYVPTESYSSYNPFLMYYQNGLEYQPYSNIITDTRLTTDLQYVAITFDYTNLSDIDLVMFSKYDYLEGTDDITYDIYVPSNTYLDNVSVVPNSNGGNDFNFNYVDSDGVLSNESFSNYSDDLTEKNELFNVFFDNFNNNFYGLVSILTAPLNLINSLTSSTCEDIVLPLPYVNRSINLPCMDSIYSTYFGSFYIIYQELISGFICYWILIDIIRLIKNFKDPANDKIEVVNL